MRIIPVLDLMNGQVVRAVAGRRQEYQPIRSALTRSADPLEVARAYRQRYGLQSLYVADLDAIAGDPPALNTFTALQADGFTLLVDAGLHKASDAAPLFEKRLDSVIAGLETLQGPSELTELFALLGPSRLVFSLDMKDGQPLTSSATWPNTPLAIASGAVALGVRRLLVLDLARVGVSSGTGTDALCVQIKDRWPGIELLAGGGIRGREDLDRLRACGVDGVLVASALHDGSLGAEDVQ